MLRPPDFCIEEGFLGENPCAQGKRQTARERTGLAGSTPRLHVGCAQLSVNQGSRVRITLSDNHVLVNIVRLNLITFMALLFPPMAICQDNYEIQVYGSETVAPGSSMIELHSNFTSQGSDNVLNGVLPTDHTFHETLEVTHGFAEDFEVGWYLFTSTVRGDGAQWVGTHVRPRVRIPQSWEWPIGAGLSAEFGYQRRIFSEDTWSIELRPIVDKQLGGLYISMNPTLEKSVRGANSSQGFQFSPNVKLSYDFTPRIALGVEYYGSLGPVFKFFPEHDQQHQLFPSVDLNFEPEWEFNFGVGFGFTESTDHLIIKMILGRRFSF